MFVSVASKENKISDEWYKFLIHYSTQYLAILCTILNHQFINTIQDEKLLIHSITTLFEKIPIIKGRKYIAKLPEDFKSWFQNVQGENQRLASWKMFLKFGLFNLILVCCSKVSNNE